MGKNTVGSEKILFYVGTRKHPKEVAAPKRPKNTGLKNPLRLVTDETVFSTASFSDLKISDKLVVQKCAAEP